MAWAVDATGKMGRDWRCEARPSIRQEYRGFLMAWGTALPRFARMSAELPPLPSSFRGEFRTDADARAVYSESAGIMRMDPLGVAIPDSVESLQALCRWALAAGVPLIPRGSGSSMSGAAVGPGVVVDLHRLRTPPVVDVAWSRLSAGAAITRGVADAAARANGLRFPVDPSSGGFATLGGMASTNAAGARTLAFGAMRTWVQALDCVFADGSRGVVHRHHALPALPILAYFERAAESLRERARSVAPRRTRKESSGYGIHDFANSGSLVDLLVGSEGTLAFIVGVELALIPLPVATATVVGSWASLEAAVEGTRLAREAGAVACELLEASFLRIAARGRSLPVPDESASVLLVELEGNDAAGVQARAGALDQAWRGVGATDVLLGLDPESEDALWALRHAASPILARMDPHLRSMQIIEDGCVPLEHLAEYIRGVTRALEAQHLEGVLFGHAGDAHLHVNALVDVRADGWQDRIRALFHEVAALAKRLEGTMAGEHGDGRLRSSELAHFWGREAVALFNDIKAIFDPTGVLNPGVKAGETPDPFLDIKYDPLKPLASRLAFRVLDEVERTRCYDRCRLEMLGQTG